MLDGRRRLALALKALAELELLGVLGADHLQRDLALEREVHRPVDDAHPAAPGDPADDVFGECRPDGELWHALTGLAGTPALSRTRCHPDHPEPFDRMAAMLLKLWMPIAERLDRWVGWARLPYLLGLATLVGLRGRLRERNLIDTGVPTVGDPSAGPIEARRPDGYFNDLLQPGMGGLDAPFGRNAPARPDPPERSPAARAVSETLFTRETFLPATGLNVMAAAWLQFEVHDWVMHDKIKAEWDLGAGKTMFKLRDAGDAFVSDETHWWDVSQLYGTKDAFVMKVRADGGELVVDDALLETIEQAVRDANSPEVNMWVALALLHIVFAREHNAIVARLHQVYPHFDDDRLYALARLINSALMAKIHTVEWTPAMIGHPTTEKAIMATWYGLLGRGV